MSSATIQRLALLVAFGFFIAEASAQSASGSRSAASGSRTVGSGSGAVGSGSGSGAKAGPTALDGYCAVCLYKGRKWVKGSPQYQVAYDGHTYLFPTQDDMAAFQADPVTYAPVLGGDDIVEYARTGQRVPGSTQFGAVLDDRFYFFASEANKREFRANRTPYENADLALGGECVVCKVDMNERRAGSPQIATTHGGVRFQFASAQQMQQFMANTARYTPAAAGSGMKGSGSAAYGSGSASGSRRVVPGSGSGSAGS